MKNKRERIKRRALETQRLQYRKFAAQYNQLDEPDTLLDYATSGPKKSDDGHP